MLAVGAEAPDFEALTDTGQTFRLLNWRGHRPVVLFFYLRAFTARLKLARYARSANATRSSDEPAPLSSA